MLRQNGKQSHYTIPSPPSVPDSSCKLQSSALQKIKYKVITALGASQSYYSSSKNKPLHGLGQDSGVSSINWLFASVQMMKPTGEIFKGYTTDFLDGSETWVKLILGFVDDAR